jgi:hypothetical protein
MATTSDPTQSPIFRQRATEAGILRNVYNTLVASHGEAVAEQTIKDAVRSASIEQAEAMAAEGRARGEEPSMRSFQQLYELWARGGALEIEVLEETETTFNFDVTRCRYSEMYREMGLGKIGHLLSCQRDGTFCEGYDPRIKMERSQTIMGGADRCTFRYRVEEQ